MAELAPLSELLRMARAERAGLGAFTCYDLETAAAVLRAASEADAPVVLLVSARSLVSMTGPGLVAGLVELAGSRASHACVELDHMSASPPRAVLADWCSPAVMIDGSALPDEDNERATRAAVETARTAGCEVEGELGRLAGDEDVVVAGRSGSLTDPADAARFVERTGVSCLAVAIGNAHGRYVSPPQLDWTRLEELEGEVPVPLALHGASGIRSRDLERAIACGITKVNFNTDLRARYFEALSSGTAQHRAALDVLGLKERVVEALRNEVTAKLALLGWPGRAQASGTEVDRMNKEKR